MSRSRSSGSGRSSGRNRHSNPPPVPTSISHSQPSAPKPSLFGWQEKSAQKTQTSSNSKPNNQGHSYPSSNTGLSGNNQQKSSFPQQESIQRSNLPSQQSVQPVKNSQSSHSYPGSNGLSGNSASGVGYPQGTGLSGANVAPPPYQGANSPGNIRPNAYSTNTFNNNNQPPHGPPPPYSSSGNNFNHHPQGPPPPYTNYGHSYGGYGGSFSPQSPGYFGGYTNNAKNFGSVSRTGSALTGVGIAGAGIGTVLTGLALWNLARSTGHHHHTVIYDNRGQPIAVAPENSTSPVVDSILADLVNCTLTINSDNITEVIAIPCSIATSFTPDADLKNVSMDNNKEDNTKCTVTVVTKAGREFMTTIPCSTLLKSAAENNVTETPIVINATTTDNSTILTTDDTLYSGQPTALRLSNIAEDIDNYDASLNCTQEPGDTRDPINPCFSLKHNLTVIPLSTEKQ
ncbi:unnamed protein product [Euphydryas editha]|nr:unnamed protein product [Euphydryas editha]